MLHKFSSGFSHENRSSKAPARAAMKSSYFKRTGYFKRPAYFTACLKNFDYSTLCLNLFRALLAVNLVCCAHGIYKVLPQTWNLKREPLVWGLDSCRVLLDGVLASSISIFSPVMLPIVVVAIVALVLTHRKLGIVDLCNLSKALAPTLSLPFWATYVTSHRDQDNSNHFSYSNEWYTKVLELLAQFSEIVLFLTALYILLSPRWKGKRSPAIAVLVLFLCLQIGISLISFMMTTNFWL